ncbi:cation:proton antiporter [Haloferacaceae archaeon DSL9]
MQVIEPLGHHELFVVIVQLILLLTAARVLGELFSRAGQPAVVGELLAGVLLGPSILGLLAPDIHASLFAVGEAQFHLLEIISWIGLLLLLIVTGLETDTDLILSKGRTAILISLGGIVVPFATGFVLGWYLPPEFVAAPDQRLVFSLFIATAMSISAIPVIAKVLIELDAIQRDIGQLILAAGMVDDTIGWILLATVAGLARSGVLDLGTAFETVISVVIFLGLAFTVGQRLVRKLFRAVDTLVGGDTAMISTLVILALTAGAITQFLGLEAILGAFVVGVLVGQVKRFDYRLRHIVEVITLGVFAPIFFAIAGLRMNVATLVDPTVLSVGVVVFAAACFGKFAGVMSVSRLAGLSKWEGITIGGGMNARGAMEIIVATIGLGLGILTVELYSIIVAVAIATSLMAPSIMRWSIPKIEMTDEERRRLERFSQRRHGFVGTLTTVLLPTRCDPGSQFAAQLVGHLTRREGTDVAAMFLDTDESRPRSRSLVDRLRQIAWPRSGTDRARRTRGDGGSSEATAPLDSTPDRCLELIRFKLNLTDDHSREFVRQTDDDATQTVLDEARSGYDLLVIGTVEAENAVDRGTVSVDRVLRESPCPVMVVDAPADGSSAAPTDGSPIRDEASIDSILLATLETEYNRNAAEVAFAVAQEVDAFVETVHVVSRTHRDDVFVDRPNMGAAMRLGREIVADEAELGRSMGAHVRTRVHLAETRPGADLIGIAEREGHDLIVIGSNLRPVTGQAFFDSRIEYVLRNAPCPVAVLTER